MFFLRRTVFSSIRNAAKTVNTTVERTLYDKPYSERSINQVTLLGRVGMVPQLRGSEKQPVVVFTLATNLHFKTEDDAFKQRTEWHKVSVFKPHLRDIVVEYCRKGSRVMVQGRIMYGEIVDVKGVTHATTTIAAEDIIFVGTASEEMKREEEEAVETQF